MTDQSTNQSAGQTQSIDDLVKNTKGYLDSSRLFKDGMTYEEFINKGIIELMGLSDLPQERQDALNEKVEKAIKNRTAARIFDALMEDEREEWDTLLKAEKFEEASKYLAMRQIDYNQWLLEELIIVKYELYEDSKIVRQQAAGLLNKQGRTGDAS